MPIIGGCIKTQQMHTSGSQGLEVPTATKMGLTDIIPCKVRFVSTTLCKHKNNIHFARIHINKRTDIDLLGCLPIRLRKWEKKRCNKRRGALHC